MKIKKIIFLLSLTSLFFFAGCKNPNNLDPTDPVNPVPTEPENNSPESETPGSDSSSSGDPSNPGSDPAPSNSGGYDPTSNLEDINPTISDKASVSQDFIFNLNSVGITNLTIRRSEWNKMLSYYDYFYKNENLVIAESYQYEKNGQTWKLKNVGFRLRGNTSRFRPQGKDFPTDETGHTKPNESWSQDYYNYAATCSDNDYRQSHFKVDFEPFEDDDRKLSECMKGVALKRSDSYFSREIFCYNLFHQYGIWTAPRASQTKVYINFVEDMDTNGNVKTDLTGCPVTKVDFGVYEMFEEVNKQSLKGRMKKKDNNTAPNAWENNDGDLWKCCGGDLTANYNVTDFGCEQIEILNTDNDKSQWDVIWYSPKYDLKTNKDTVPIASSSFQSFITELNNLPSTENPTDDEITSIKNFYEKWFDLDFFIKTYAVNILVGMDDDYWGNANNYYLYFDNAKKGSGKCYLIPFDYDNSLGCSITGDKTYANPLQWGYDEYGNKRNRPLLDKLLLVPEYKQKFIDTLLEVSSQELSSPWNKNNCINLWNQWRNQVIPYVSTPDIKGWPNVGSTGWNDDGGWKEKKHYLAQDYDNLYEQVTLNLKLQLSAINTDINFDLNNGSLNGQTGTITKPFDGKSQKFTDIAGGNPTRSGYAFLGWTKTKDGKDFTENYIGESGLTVYAKWLQLTASKLNIYEIEDDSYQGIKLYIDNLPAEYFTRIFTIDGREVSYDNKEDNDGKPNSKYGNIWCYPFAEKGKTYDIQVTYRKENYDDEPCSSNTLHITAKSGIGEFKVLNNPSFVVQNNTLKWTTKPIIQVGDSRVPRTDDNWNEYYLLEFQTTSKLNATSGEYENDWNYQSWNYLGANLGDFNFKDHLSDNQTIKQEVLSGIRKDLRIRLKYQYTISPYGDLFLLIYDYYDIPDPINLE